MTWNELNKKMTKIALIVFGAVCLGMVCFFVAFCVSLKRGEDRARQIWADQASGKLDFGDHPALFPVAQAIAANDQEAVRATAKALPDLNAPGRDGTTLLCFAVQSSWQRAELVEAVRTLLSLGVDPNYTNGQRKSFALANAVHGPVLLLRVMLDAGGDPNARNEFGEPLILKIWYLGYYKQEERARLNLLLERGADLNSTMPENRYGDSGYSLLLYRTKMGPEDELAYVDALHLLERGADPNRAGLDGMTFAKMLRQHREQFSREKKAPPQSFEPLWAWAQTHGILSPSE